MLCKVLKFLGLTNKLSFFGTNVLEINNTVKVKVKLTWEIFKKLLFDFSRQYFENNCQILKFYQKIRISDL